MNDNVKSDNLKSEKDRLRKRYRLERHDGYIPAEFLNLLEITEVKSAQVIASYISYGDEPVTKLLNQELIAAGKTLLLPRIDGPELIWVQWNGDLAQIDFSKKIPEPMGISYLNLAAIDLVLVPALRMDSEGFRLGQGGGYYDRFLPKISAWKIGLLHDGELSSQKLPREAHDIALNAAATPDLIIRFKA
jgi:5-formyltetrahydrofolate cyclo-ligase